MSAEAPKLVTVGSSDVPAILGLSPWTSPTKTWARLTGLIPRYDSDGTAATRRGRILEAALLDEWARLRQPLGRTPGPTLAEEPATRDGWKAARVDMLAVLEDGPVIVEAKTTRGWDGWGEDGTADVPVYYAAQVAWQMHVLDIDRAEVVAYCPLDDGLRIYPLARNAKVEAALVGKVTRWMERHVWGDEPEQPAPLPMDVLARAYPANTSRDYVAPSDGDLATARELATVRAQIAELEAYESALRARLCERVGLAYGIKGVCTWGRVKGRETVDMTALKSRYPKVWEAVKRETQASRVFRLTHKGE